MRPQLACFRINDRKFLFDAESKCMILCAHGGAANLRQKSRAVIPSREVDEGPHPSWRITLTSGVTLEASVRSFVSLRMTADVKLSTLCEVA